MTIIKTPEQLKKLKPLKRLAMTSLSEAALKDFDIDALLSGHKYMVVYNKRTRICKELYDLTLAGISEIDRKVYSFIPYQAGAGRPIEIEEENDAD